MSIAAMTWVFANSKATLGSRLVLLALADHAHPDGTKAFPAVATLAEQTLMSRRAVQSALRGLEADGHVVVTGKTRSGTVIYAIAGMGGVETTPRVENDLEGAKLTTSRGEASTPEPSGTVKEPSTGKNKQKAEPLGFEEWLAHHRQVSESDVCRPGTRIRAKVASAFSRALGEGYSVEQLKVVSSAGMADAWRREHGLTDPESVLRPAAIEKLLANHSRAFARRENDPLDGVELAPTYSKQQIAAMRS